MEKEMKILMGKNLDIFKFFFWWKLSRWKKKPGRSKDFFASEKRNDFFPKRNGKRNENPDGKKSGHLQVFFLVEIIQVGKKTWKI